MNRRKFLAIAGSAGVIVAAGTGGFLATRTPEGALKPWKNAGSLYSGAMSQALSYAILAPNPHNRQPWLIDLKSGTEAVLTCDPDRLLPVTDPFSRQIAIGLGCFLELFSLAAAAQGYRAHIRYFPEGEPGDVLEQRPIAHLSLKKQDGLAGNPLFAHVLKRRTNRQPYEADRAIPDDLARRLRRGATDNVQVDTTTGGKLLRDLRVLTRDAMLTEVRTAAAYQESIDLMRIGRAEIEANPDGIALGGGFLESLKLAGMLSRESLANSASRAYQMGLTMFEAGAMSAMGFVWIMTGGNSRTAQIEAGRAYLRIALQATANGLAMQPMSQPLQEYAAMAPYYKAIHDRLAGKSAGRVQMLARLGYTEAVGPAPRWPLETRLKEA
ncbi:MAG: twin-arginine translocation pathway signal protein [Alphaproteobacteria bacterium]|nr:twin-arginine translocation pathway signal protein [Alphaproteobacteria bacterium]